MQSALSIRARGKIFRRATTITLRGGFNQTIKFYPKNILICCVAEQTGVH